MYTHVFVCISVCMCMCICVVYVCKQAYLGGKNQRISTQQNDISSRVPCTFTRIRRIESLLRGGIEMAPGRECSQASSRC